MRTHARAERSSRLLDKADDGLARSDRWPHEIWIETDAAGVVIGSAPAAVLLTGYSARALQGRALPIMFVKDRPTEAQFRHVLLGHFVERDSLIRPRERRAIPVRYRVELSPGGTDHDPILRWTFERIG